MQQHLERSRDQLHQQWREQNWGQRQQQNQGGQLEDQQIDQDGPQSPEQDEHDPEPPSKPDKPHDHPVDTDREGQQQEGADPSHVIGGGQSQPSQGSQLQAPGNQPRQNQQRPQHQRFTCKQCGSRLSGRPSQCPGCGTDLAWGAV